MQLQQRLRNDAVTLARGLSKLGVVSRSQACVLIRQGRIRVGKRVIRNPDVWINLRRDQLSLDGVLLEKQRPIYLAMNKPAGVVTTRSDELGRDTVYQHLPPGCKWVFPVGRLDKESSGLLLFTNDTRFGEVVTSPEGHVPKTYAVCVDKPLGASDRRALELPTSLERDVLLKSAIVNPDPENPCCFHITIHEGKNRQIRRLCEKLGYQVVSLHRLSIGPITVGSLKPGQVRRLTKEERERILSWRVCPE
jgi:23S rRNA pseudouridine2605 synthase